jgi:hypothetical protein
MEYYWSLKLIHSWHVPLWKPIQAHTTTDETTMAWQIHKKYLKLFVCFTAVITAIWSDLIIIVQMYSTKLIFFLHMRQEALCNTCLPSYTEITSLKKCRKKPWLALNSGFQFLLQLPVSSTDIWHDTTQISCTCSTFKQNCRKKGAHGILINTVC